jgi:replicative DNA helicase
MVLAALLTYPAMADHLTAVLDAGDFTLPDHRQVFAAATAAHRHGRPCTPAAVAAHLPKTAPTGPGASTAAGRERLMRDLTRAVPAQIVTVHYAAIVRELAALRRCPSSPEGLPPAPMRGFLTDDT